MAQITAIVSVAQAVGPNRIVKGQGIVYPVGDSTLPADEERELRRRLVEEALKALSTDAAQSEY